MSNNTQATQQTPSFFQTYYRLWGYLSNYWLIFLVAVMAMIVVAVTSPLFAMLLKPLVNEGFVAGDLASMAWIPVAIVGLFILRGVANFTNEYLTAYLTGHLVASLRQELFGHMQKLPIGYFRQNTSGRVISRILNDVGLIAEAGFRVITVVAKDGLTVVGLLGLLFYLDWRLTLITLLSMPIVALCIRIVAARLKRLSHENQVLIGQMTQVVQENIEACREVKIYGGMAQEAARFADAAVAVRRNLVKQAAADSANRSITLLVVAIALAVIIYFAGVRAQSNQFSAGDFMAFISAMIMLFDPVKRLTNVLQSLQRGMAAAETVFEFLDLPQEIAGGDFCLAAGQKIQGDIVFEGVSFRYPQASADSLDTINLVIKAGSTVALVGHSGCGKTTLIHLLARFDDPSTGRILLDGRDLKDYDLKELRRQIALVGQNAVLFHASIKDNIAYGDKQKASDEEVQQALEAAHAWPFIKELPQQIHSMIGERGSGFSGGQNQRLALARAVMKNAPILILDEATSALDSASEKAVQAALKPLMQNRTTIMVAHRLSTVESADEIIVMEQGRIVERGSHQALLAKKGAYATLYRLQQSQSE